MKRVALFTFLILSTLAVTYLLWEFQTAVMLFIFSLALAATFRPLIIWLAARKIPYGIAVFLVYLAFSGLLVALIVTLTPAVVNEFGKMINDLALAYDQIWKQWPSGTFIQQVLI
ncbi:MAG: AI-2E family transporter, partial [Anaerolineaceae bacterium]|nr:AI-2E family transporter [Anaerolineaceae bacterium]